jgi:hypothetical protein
VRRFIFQAKDCACSDRLQNSATLPEIEEAQEIFAHPNDLNERSDLPEQHWAISWAGQRLYTGVFNVREDNDGDQSNRTDKGSKQAFAVDLCDPNIKSCTKWN